MKADRIPLVSVIGGSRCSDALGQQAELAGRLLVEAGLGIVCGGGAGIMQAACRGAYNAGGMTVGLLPGDDPAAGNEYLRISIPTGIGQARNALVVHAGLAVLAIGGSYGTLSEIAFALRKGKPVIGLETWQAVDGEGQAAGIEMCASVEEAVHSIVRLVQASMDSGG